MTPSISVGSPSPEARPDTRGWARLDAEDAARREYLDRVAYDRPRYTNERCLTDDEVRAVRRLVLDGVPQSVVARRLGVARGTVNKIVWRKRYAEVR